MILISTVFHKSLIN